MNDIDESCPTDGESTEMEQANDNGIPEGNDDFVPPEGDSQEAEQADEPNKSADGEGETAPPPCDWKNASGDDDSRPDKDDDGENTIKHKIIAGKHVSLGDDEFSDIIDIFDGKINEALRVAIETKKGFTFQAKITFDYIGGAFRIKHDEGYQFDPIKVKTKGELPEDIQIVLDESGNPIIPDDREHQVTFDELQSGRVIPPATVTVDGKTGIVENYDDGNSKTPEDDDEPEGKPYPCKNIGCPFYGVSDVGDAGCRFYAGFYSGAERDVEDAILFYSCTRPEVLQAYADGQVNKESDDEFMETNVIKLKFIKDGKPAGREYTYYTNTVVEVGDTVEVDGKQGVSQGVVTQINVPESEIEPFKDKAKTIIGKVVQPDEKVSSGTESTLSE